MFLDSTAYAQSVAPASAGSLGGFVLSYLPLILLCTIPLGLLCFALSRHKGRKPWVDLLLGLIPGFNFYYVSYMIGCRDQALSDKMDKVINLLDDKH